MGKDTSAKDTKTARREKLAADRAAQAAKEARQRRIMTVVGIVVVLGVVVATGIAIQSSRNDTTDAALPATVTEPGGPIVRNPDTTGVPVLDYWEDFQCPACKAVEDATGSTVAGLASANEVIVNYHMLSFLDGNLQNDSSSRAANAFACSADAGVQGAYHDTVYANQPTEEGQGYTDEQLIQFGTDAGVTADAMPTFEACVNDTTYRDYVSSVAKAGATAGISSTPTVLLNGTPVPSDVLKDPQALTAAITSAAGG